MSPYEILRQASWAIGKYVPRNSHEASFLEIGIGWGMYGMLMRNFFDAWFGRFGPEQYAMTIDAIDGSAIEHAPFVEQVYDNIMVGDALDILPSISANSYDVVYAVEVLEHIPKERGVFFLNEMKRIARRGVVVTTPHPDCWESQEDLHGNEFERHLSVWRPDELESMNFVIMNNRPSYVAYHDVLPKIGIGVVTYNRVDLLEVCFPTWQAVENAVLAVFDSGSDNKTVEWLKSHDIDHLTLSETNVGCWVGRNRLVEYFRDEHSDIEFVLLPDSDVELLPGSVGAMLSVARMYPDAGFVAWPQANKGFPVAEEGYVEEVASECNLTRMEMWRDVKYPESLVYYSGDSWCSTIANMLGWRTVLVQGQGEGYVHHAHGSTGNEGVNEIAEKDVGRWQEIEARMARYWEHRFEHGKGSLPE